MCAELCYEAMRTNESVTNKLSINDIQTLFGFICLPWTWTSTMMTGWLFFVIYVELWSQMFRYVLVSSFIRIGFFYCSLEFEHISTLTEFDLNTVSIVKNNSCHSIVNVYSKTINSHSIQLIEMQFEIIRKKNNTLNRICYHIFGFCY